MTAKVLQINNHKGGVSKTTLTANIGIGLARKGYNVLLLDLDPQGHLSMMTGELGSDGYPYEGVFNLLAVDEKGLDDVIISLDKFGCDGWLGMIPGGNKTTLTDTYMMMQAQDYKMLSREIAPLAETLDYIVVDTSPKLAMMTQAIMAFSDAILIPTKMASMDINSVGQTVNTMTNLAAIHNAKLLGIVPTQTEPNTLEHRDKLMELIALYGEDVVWDDYQIRKSTVWTEASDVAMPIFDYVPDHSASDQMIALVDKIEKELEVINV